MSADGEQSPADEAGGEGRAEVPGAGQLLLGVLEVLLLVVCHGLHGHQGEVGEGGQPVHQVDVGVGGGGGGGHPGGGGEAQQEVVLVEADEEEVEQRPARPRVEDRPLPHVHPPVVLATSRSHTYTSTIHIDDKVEMDEVKELSRTKSVSARVPVQGGQE